MSEVKDLMSVNKAGKKKAKKKGAKKGAKRRTARKTGRKAAPRRRRATAAKTSTRRRRRSTRRNRNPGIDTMGSGAAFLGGAMARLVTKPVAKFVAGKTDSAIARAAVDVLVPALAGIGTQMLAPNLGKGMVAVAGANTVDHAMSAVIKQAPTVAPVVQKLGFGELGEPTVTREDGQYFLSGPAGKKALMPVDGRVVSVQMDDGSTEQVKILGPMGEGTLVENQMGELEVLEGLGELAPANSVDGVEGLEPANTVGDDDDLSGEDDGLGDEDGALL